MNASRILLLVLLPCLAISAAAHAQVTVSLEPVEDNTIYSEDPGLSNALGSRLFSGATLTGGIRRGLLRFDVAGSIPAGSTITGASLTLQVVMALTGTPIQNDLHRLTSPWGEGTSLAPGGQGGGGMATPFDATWTENFLGVSFWFSPGGDFVAASSATAGAGGTGTSAVFASTAALVADVQSWLDAPGGNAGWILIGNEATLPTARAFGSREAQAGERPVLTITYLPPAPMASATSVGTGCSGSVATPLTLAANGLPQLGNLGFALDVSGGPGNVPAPLFIATGIAAVPFPISATCNVYLDLTSAIALVQSGASPIFTNVLDAAGATSYPIPLPNVPVLAGFAADFQIVLADSVGLISSNAVSLVLGT